MTHKRLFRAVASAAAIVLLFTVLAGPGGVLTAKAVTQGQIDTLKQQQKEVDKKQQELQKQINSLKTQRSDLLTKKQLLDQQAQLTLEQIENINDQIAKYDDLIAQKTDELEKALEAEAAHLVRYKTNMRTMEESGPIAYISVIFQANSFSDLLSRINDIGEIMEYQESLYTQLKKAEQATRTAKSALETAKAAQEEDRTDLTQKQALLQKQVNDALQLLQTIQSNLDSTSVLYDQEKASANKIQSEINQKVAELRKQQELEAQQRAQQQQQNNSNSNNKNSSSVVGTGVLAWPVPSCWIVTSPFGMRMHPIGKSFSMHYGVDIGAEWGSSIVAADGGTVIEAGYDDGGYGYFMVLDHGNGVTTLYAHLAKFVKSNGSSVKKGDTIAKSGSTGASTGPHLHFEVSKNGTRVDPLKYFSGYSKYY